MSRKGNNLTRLSYLFALLFLLSAAQGSAQVRELEFNPKLGSPHSTAVIPFQMRAGYPFVDITLGGERYNLLIDMTDYRPLTLSKHMLDIVPHTVLGTERYGGADDKVYHLTKFAMEEVRFGKMIKRNVQGTEEALDPNFPTPSPRGAIGAAMFFDDVMTFDFQNQNIKIETNTAMPNCESLASLGIPLVTLARYRSKTLTFFLDIAYQYSVIDSGLVQMEQRQGSETRAMPSVFTIEQLEFDNFTLENLHFVPLPMADSGIQGVLGMDVFRRYNLAIDFPNNCYQLPLAKQKKSKGLTLDSDIPRSILRR